MGALVLAVIVHHTALLLFLNIDKLEKGGCSQSKDAKAQIWNRPMAFLEPKHPTDETGLCPACGRTRSSVDNFCLRCGHNLHADQALAPAAPPWAAPGTVPQPLHATPEWVPPAPLAAAPAVPASLTERRARIILRSVNGEVLGEYDLTKPETSVGRGSDNDLVVPNDKHISRHQAASRCES